MLRSRKYSHCLILMHIGNKTRKVRGAARSVSMRKLYSYRKFNAKTKILQFLQNIFLQFGFVCNSSASYW